MKIGQFARQNNVTIDTVRYYMELGLIIPHKNGGQYEFDHSCTKDIEDIQQLKELGFTLQEIKTFFYYKQFVKVENNVSNKYYSAFFKRKLEDTRKTIESLSRNLKIMEDRHAIYDDKENQPSEKIGLELGSLNMLCCPACGGSLALQRGTIEDNQVMAGYLACTCGERFEIKDGILIIEREPEKKDDSSDNSVYKEAELLFEYIKSTNPVFLDMVRQSLTWFDYKTGQNDYEGKAVLELGVGMGAFLRSAYDKLGDDTVYFAVDQDIKALKLVKSIIESSGNKKKIVFICADFSRLPLKAGCIDVLVDYSGTSNYSFGHCDFLLESMTAYLKDNARLFGGFMMFDKFGKHCILPQEYRHNYTLNCVKNAMDHLNFTVTDETCTQKYYCKETSQYEELQQVGDSMFLYLCISAFVR